MKKMLLVFAHPDDESFICGGTIAKYVHDGWRADLLCATKGESGLTGPHGETKRSKLGEIRQKELESAGTILGLTSVTLLGYTDGTLRDEQAGDVEDKIYQHLRKEIPDIVITFDTTGVSNHPDHVKVCYATTYAFQKYAQWIGNQVHQHPEYSEDIDPKLYYACLPSSVVSYLIRHKVIPDQAFGKPWTGTPDKFVTTVLDIADYESVKKQALLAHKSQHEDVDRFLSFSANPLLRQEHFILRMQGIKEVFMGNKDQVSQSL